MLTPRRQSATPARRRATNVASQLARQSLPIRPRRRQVRLAGPASTSRWRAPACAPDTSFAPQTFRLARIWIQATPATNIVSDSSAKALPLRRGKRGEGENRGRQRHQHVGRRPPPQGRHQRRTQQRAHSEEAQQQTVTLRAKRMRQQRQQCRQSAGRDAEDRAAHQHALHRVRAAHVAKAVEHGL